MEILYKNCITDVYQELEQLFTHDEWCEKYIVLFGKNNSSEIELDYFRENGIPVQGFIDNDEKKQGMSYQDCNVFKPEDLLGEYKKNAFILIASVARKAMRRQLISMGYDDSQIYDLKTFDINLTESFEKDNRYTYTELSLREIQLETLEIMKVVRDFCEKKGLRYYLSYGALIGAVRHKGFIPWDDDIDVIMPWRDYIWFCKEFPKDGNYDVFSAYSENENHPLCNVNIAKVMKKDTIAEMFNFPVFSRRSICVDIFPMNGYPETEAERVKYDAELKSLGTMWGRRVNRKIATDLFSEKEYAECRKITEEAMTRYDYETSSYVGSVACAPYNHSIAPKERYEEPSKVVFEGEEFAAPHDVDYVLRETYGDYMQLPPEEERKPKHFFHTYRVEEK